jgi:hypothetical protein
MSLQKYDIKFSFSYNDVLGCTRDELKIYIIDNLQENMTLKNFGQWEMDHTYPISKFNFKTLDDVKKCFNYTNIKPMWKEENRKKSNKIL